MARGIHGTGRRARQRPTPLMAHALNAPCPPPMVPREALQSRLAQSRTAVLLVLAGPGWGKTTATRALACTRPTAWISVRPDHAGMADLLGDLVDAVRSVHPQVPAELRGLADQTTGPQAADGEAAEAIATRVTGALPGGDDAPSWLLVLDEVDALPPRSGGAQLVDALLRRLPDGCQVAMTARQRPAIDLSALASRGALTEVTAAALRLGPDQTVQLVEDVLGPDTRTVGLSIHDLTAGWPAAVRLIAESLRDVAPDARSVALADRARGVGAFLTGQVLHRLSPRRTAVLHLAARVPWIDRRLLAELGLDDTGIGDTGIGDTGLDELVERGLVDGPDTGGRFRIAPVLASMLAGVAPEGPESPDRTRILAAYRAVGAPATAMTAALDWDDEATAAGLLAEDGAALLGAGEVAVLARAAEVVAPDRRDRATEELLGQALMVRGDWTGALTCLRRAADGADPLPVRVAWRLGLIHYLRGEVPAALAVYDAAADPDPEDYEAALLLAFEACARWVGGQLDVARQVATDALAIASRFGDPHALSAVHTALAMVAAADGDRVGTEQHFRDGIGYAEQGGSILQIVRLRANHASHLTDEGAYAEALAELDIAGDLADLTGFAVLRLLVASNRAEVRRRLGRVDEAEADARHAIALGRELGTGLVIHPQLTLADIQRDRGQVERAAASYAEVITRADTADDVQALVPALAGAARVAPDPTEAYGLAEQAVARAVGIWALPARLARGWIAVRVGDHEQARADASWALAEARRRRVRNVEAEAHEMLAVLEDDRTRCEHHLRTAGEIHGSLGAVVDELRVTAALVGLGVDDPSGDDVIGRRRELAAHGRVAQVAGLEQVLDMRGGSAVDDHVRAPAVEIRTLGGFTLLRDGAVVPTTEWRSRKARDLLRILIARRGAHTSRSILAETLWPGEDPDRTANRLSAAISVVRAVLDPAKAHPADHYVASDPSAVWVEVDRMEVDLERFHTEIASAMGVRDRDGAERALAAAAGRYAGEFLADEPYEDWAVPAREQARAAYLQALRTLIGLATDRGDHDTAIGRSLRLLAEDPYDEDGYAELIGICTAAGRHGEAQRHYRRYAMQMHRLGVTPMPFPGALGLRELA